MMTSDLFKNQLAVAIRLEQPQDAAAIRAVNDQAFGQPPRVESSKNCVTPVQSCFPWWQRLTIRLWDTFFLAQLQLRANMVRFRAWAWPRWQCCPNIKAGVLAQSS